MCVYLLIKYNYTHTHIHTHGKQGHLALLCRMLFLRTFSFVTLFLGGFAAPIPPKPDGFIYKPPSICPPSSITQLSAFYDLLCPDSRASWPVIKAVAEHYGSLMLQTRVHTFPLPYHRNAFLANQAGQAIAAQKESDFFPWMEAVYAHQESYYNVNTTNKTEVDVKSMLANLAFYALDYDPVKVMGWLEYGSRYDGATRTSWKYACSKGVTGTPIFFVNGVAVDADASWTVAQWLKLLDAIIYPSSEF